ncbi:MAG: hypothetical protein IT280_12920 [Ignavibacteria bacterium]|nr:hypothetical protein [Ignavibacteria bacterium]
MDYKKIKSFEDACKARKIDPKALPEVSMLPVIHQKAIVAHYKLIIIAEAINDGWQPNWNDSNEWKYYPWFEVETDEDRPAGFGFSCTSYVGWSTITSVGSRLCFKTRETAVYAGKQFADLYKEYMLIMPESEVKPKAGKKK